MILKIAGNNQTNLSYFDLLGDDENALSKAFTYVLAKDSQAYSEFLKLLGIKYLNITNHYPTVKIDIQKKRKEGITDIELFSEGYYQIIIECKIDNNKVKQQRKQYIPCFDSNAKRKILCFITQERENNLSIESDVKVIYLSWIDIVNVFDQKSFNQKKLISDFLTFIQRSYRIKMVREILIQDLSESIEIEKFIDYNLYGRDETYGNPLYFAPYFTQKSNRIEGEGISYLSKILGVLTIIPSEITCFEEELTSFTDDNDLISNWITGLKFDKKIKAKKTYFFLDKPFKFKTPLQKVLVQESKNWIGGLIPKNRCVTFEEFIKHIPELL